jgi:hypothetical protein
LSDEEPLPIENLMSLSLYAETEFTKSRNSVPVETGPIQANFFVFSVKYGSLKIMGFYILILQKKKGYNPLSAIFN